MAQAIRITTPTAASSVNSAGRMPATMLSCRPMTSADSFALLSGYCTASRSEMVFISAPACSTVTPGFNRGDHSEEVSAARWIRRRAPAAARTRRRPMNANPAGITPMTVTGAPLSVTL